MFYGDFMPQLQVPNPVLVSKSARVVDQGDRCRMIGGPHSTGIQIGQADQEPSKQGTLDQGQGEHTVDLAAGGRVLQYDRAMPQPLANCLKPS